LRIVCLQADGVEFGYERGDRRGVDRVRCGVAETREKTSERDPVRLRRASGDVDA
jgi:hypothetical protein